MMFTIRHYDIAFACLNTAFYVGSILFCWVLKSCRITLYYNFQNPITLINSYIALCHWELHICQQYNLSLTSPVNAFSTFWPSLTLLLRTPATCRIIKKKVFLLLFKLRTQRRRLGGVDQMIFLLLSIMLSIMDIQTSQPLLFH